MLADISDLLDANRRIEGECILWTGATLSSRGNKHRYGVIRRNGKLLRVHRLAWERECGPIPAGKQILHTCDTPLCFNVEHLFIGTNADNVADRVAKGRSARLRGEDHPRSVLTAAQAREIRTRYAEGGISIWQLACAYGCSEQPIISVLHFETYPDAGGPAMPQKRAPNAKLTLADYAMIKQRVAAGDRRAVIAREYAIHPGSIKRILKH